MQNALSVATSLKNAFSSLREHLQFNFNSNVSIDQMVWYVPKRGPFCPKTWSVLFWSWSVCFGRGPFCHDRGPFCPWSVMSLIRLMQVHRTKSKYQLHNEI